MSKAKRILYGDEARAKLIDGVNKVADAVASTIGPKGRDVIIDNPNEMPPTITNDGVTIAAEITLEDPWENLGAKIVKQAADKTNNDAGDGTTTATVLTREIVRRGQRLLATGMNPIDIKKGIMEASDSVAKRLVGASAKIQDAVNRKEKLRQIATISGQDTRIGDCLSEVFDAIGQDSVVTMEDSPAPGITFVLVDGFTFNSGVLHSVLCTNTKEHIAEMRNAKILVSSIPLTSTNDIIQWLPGMVQAGMKEVVIVAPSFTGPAVNSLLANHIGGQLKCILIKAPHVGDRQKEVLSDLALVVGATLVDPQAGMSLTNVQNGWLGKAEKIVSGKEKTVIFHGAGEDKIPERIDEIKGMVENEKFEWKQEQLKERIACLGAGVAVIQVGAQTELEQKELRFKLEDAINATRSAIEEGYLPGGGVALYKAAEYIRKYVIPEPSSSEFATGFALLLDACSAPLKQIIENAGQNSGAIMAKITDSEDFEFGWNASTGEFGNLVEFGVVDPTKVVKSAILNAASAASTLLITNTAITYAPDQSNQNRAANPED